MRGGGSSCSPPSTPYSLSAQTTTPCAWSGPVPPPPHTSPRLPPLPFIARSFTLQSSNPGCSSALELRSEAFNKLPPCSEFPFPLFSPSSHLHTKNIQLPRIFFYRRFVFDPGAGVGAGFNILALVATSRWPAILILGWSVSGRFWRLLGARAPPKSSVPISVSVVDEMPVAIRTLFGRKSKDGATSGDAHSASNEASASAGCARRSRWLT